jgi:hypothetical protein
MLLRIAVNFAFFAALSVSLWFYVENLSNFIYALISLTIMFACVTFKPSIITEMWTGLHGFVRLFSCFKNILEMTKYSNSIINTKVINLNKELLAAGCNALKFPNTLRINRLSGDKIDIIIKSPEELFYWDHYQGMSFAIGLMSGEVERIRLDTSYLSDRGHWIRNGGQTEWPKYYNSIVMAHVEVLKYAQKKKNRQLSAVHRIFRHYGEEVFAWIYP